MNSEARTFATVTRVQSRLRKLLAPALEAKPFWLRAELSSVSHSNGRLYCDLVEMQGGRIVAKLRCTIWPKELSGIRARLKQARLDELLEEGNEVGVCCRIQYHELYGMSVNAVDIDPNESLGALERKRQEIIETLSKAGLLETNRQYLVPTLPRRIGLVASRGTAGYKDFVATIERSGYSMEIYAADARVEGADTERSVLHALARMSELDLDLVVVLRGGGSRVSLSYLDNESIARAIANHRHPVWTGIGHEIDTSVLDAVSHTSFKTPTAVAEHLVARYKSADEKLQAALKELRNLAALRLRPERERMDEASGRIEGLVERALEHHRSAYRANATSFRLLVQQRLTREDAHLNQRRSELQSLTRERTSLAMHTLGEHRKSLHKTIRRALERHHERRQQLRERFLSPHALNRLHNEQQRTQSWRQVLRAADPARNLERGYALVYTSDGTLVQSLESIEAGDTIKTRLADGELTSTVVETNSNE